MTVRRALSVVVGMTQGAIGVLALILVCVIYFNLLNIQTTLNVSPELLPLSLLFLGVFGFFSVMSGLFLLHER